METEVIERVATNETTDELFALILLNDNVNSFNWVIRALIEVCSFSSIQAEQCAYIAHYKGKCEIKTGSKENMLDLRKEFAEREIGAIVEKI